MCYIYTQEQYHHRVLNAHKLNKVLLHITPTREEEGHGPTLQITSAPKPPTPASGSPWVQPAPP